MDQGGKERKETREGWASVEIDREREDRKRAGKKAEA